MGYYIEVKVWEKPVAFKPSFELTGSIPVDRTKHKLGSSAELFNQSEELVVGRTRTAWKNETGFYHIAVS